MSPRKKETFGADAMTAFQRLQEVKEKALKRQEKKGRKSTSYFPEIGEYLDAIFDEKAVEETARKLKVQKVLEENNLPKIISWYLFELEKKGFDITKISKEFEFPLSHQQLFKSNDEEYLSLNKLYYKYWFSLKGKNFTRDKSFHPLSWIASGIYAYIQNDFDYLIMANGLEGTGKSSIAINLALRLKALGLGFNPLTNIFFRNTPEDYILSVIENTERQVFIFDEARAHFWKRQAQTKGQKNRILSLTLHRARNHVYILCTRQPDDIDVDLRNSRVGSVLYSVDKGEIAFLVNRNLGFGSADPFGFKKLEFALKYGNAHTPHQLRKIILNLPSLHAYFKVEPLPKPVYKAYKQLKMALNKISDLSISGITKERITSIALSDPKIAKMIAKKLGIEVGILQSAVIADLVQK